MTPLIAGGQSRTASDLSATARDLLRLVLAGGGAGGRDVRARGDGEGDAVSAIVAEAPEIKAARLFVHTDTEHDKHALMAHPNVTAEWILATDGKRGIRIKRPEGIAPAPVVGFPGLLAVMASWEKAPVFAETTTTRSVLMERLSAVLEWRTDNAECDAEGCEHGRVDCLCSDCGSLHSKNCPTCHGSAKHPTKMRSFASPEKVFVVSAPALGVVRAGSLWEASKPPAVPLANQVLVNSYYLTDALSALSILGVEAITLRSAGAGGALVIAWDSGAIVIMGISQ